MSWSPGAVLRACATSFVGFGAMNAFRLVIREDPGLKGLYDYFSSSWGDALLLPIIVGSLHEAIHQLPPAKGERIATIVGSLLGAAAGIKTQLDWLTDPNVDPNWTIPEPGLMNVAGWYHAAFLVGLSSYLSGQTARVAVRLADASRQGNDRGQAIRNLSITLSAAAAFSLLLAIDNYHQLDREASRSSMQTVLAGLGLVALVGAYLVFVARRAKKSTE